MMNFTYVEFPCTVDLNIFETYINPKRCILPKNIHGKTFEDGQKEYQINPAFKSLRHLVLDAIIVNWKENPIYEQLPTQADRNYLLSNLETDQPLQILSEHIREDFFWRRSYQERWTVLRTSLVTAATMTNVKPAWINIYMERHLQEFIQQLDPGAYESHCVQKELDICAVYINHLEIDCLQPAMDEEQIALGFIHIPLDLILCNLSELRTLRLTYAAKTMGFHYYTGCNTMSHNDILHLARGLRHCHELESFSLHNTTLETYQLRFLAQSLDKGCHHLTGLSLVNTAMGDEGLLQFLEACHRESFSALKSLDLTNNKISAEGALRLSRALRGRALEKLSLRRNAIGSDGAAAIISILLQMPLKFLDLAACSLNVAITRLFMQLMVDNETLREVDLTNNGDLNEEFGKQLYKVIGFNKTLQNIELQNTAISLVTRKKLKDVLDKNKKDESMIWFKKKANFMR